MTKFIVVLAFIIPNFASASYWGELNQAAHKFLASPTGASGTMTARLIDPTDVPTLNQNTTGTASNVTGVVAVLNGGSGQTTVTAAFDALSPLGAKGDTLVYNSTTGHNVKFTACADGDQIQFDSTVAGIGIKCVVPASGSGTVTAVSIATANGFSGSSSGGATPALTIVASGCNGVCKSNATTLSTAAASDITGQLLTGFSSGAGTVAATDTILQGFNKLAGNQAGFLPTAGTGLAEPISGDIETVSDKTYVLDLSAAFAYTINTLIIATSSGTSTVALKINGTNVTGISAVSVSSALATGTATAANSVAIGDKVTLVTSATASAVNMAFTIKVTRQ